MDEAIVLQSPPTAASLFLLFHGVGSTPQDLAPLGARLAQEFADAAVVSIAAPDRSDLGAGLQWFSVLGVTEGNRPQRVAATLPRFLATVQHWQQRTGVAAGATTLIGFSQGAILSLAAAHAEQSPAARVVSLSGRYPELPQQAPAGVTVHFIHGDADPVIPVAQAHNAARALDALRASVTLDVVPGLGHGINPAAAERLLRRLRAP